jgi:hypothetical protein
MAYIWDATTGRYLDADGDPVPARALRAAVRTVVDDSADRLGILAERFAAGRLDLVGWRDAVRQELRTSYGVAASLAQGGVAQMDSSARGFLGSQLREAYQFLDVFSLDVSQGRVDLASDAFRARAQMYAGGAHTTFYAFQERAASARGYQRERNVLEGGSAHCAGCEAEAARGWVPVGTLSIPGSRDCVSNCRCEIQYGVGAEVAA